MTHDVDGQTFCVPPLTWRVIEVESMTSDSGAFGCEDITKQEVRVSSNITDEQMTVTLWHELAHILNDQAGLRQDPDNEEILERVIEVQSFGMVAALQNPRNAWFTSRLCGVSEEALAFARAYDSEREDSEDDDSS